MKQLYIGSLCALAAIAFSSAVVAANDWENTAVNSINREPARAYSMPLADIDSALNDKLEPDTPYKTSLNGIWKISWCGEPSLRPLDFWKTDFDDSDWYTVDVPSCLEMRGFGAPGYTNVRYPHANKWPLILDRDTNRAEYNPVASYRRTFKVPANWKGREVFLRFDGVYSAYYVWVNGHKVGYAEDSKLPSEFRITKYLKPGNNQLAVEVYRWCDGSYLEDQDMFRFTGIFRDVTLFSTPKTELNDFTVTTKFDGAYKNAELRVAVKARSLDGKGGNVSVTGRLYDADMKEVAALPAAKFFLPTTGALAGDAVGVTVAAPRKWSSEDPYLYTLVLMLTDARGARDIRTCKVGFKDVRISGNTVLFNGKPIKFKGVNRHECSVDNGRTVSLSEMKKDIRLFKAYNIDTVRTSHYPNHHLWYKLCDKYGIYVVAEANVEGHEPGYGNEGLGRHQPWFDTIVERNVRHVENYKNHASIYMWSMGNETGHGQGFVNAIKEVKKLDPTRIVHWERGNGDADIDSSMYPAVEWLEQRGKLGNVNKGSLNSEGGGHGYAIGGHTAGKAYFACEYAHAMGNAIGNYDEYWQTFYAYPALSGGCIWDWVDQALWKYTDRVCPKTGKRERFLAYGGDWDESPNDGPFCCNGVVDPFRNVSAKLVEVAHVHRNLVVEKYDPSTGRAKLWNRFGFTGAEQFDGKWELLENGKVVTSGSFTVPAVAPLSRGEFVVKPQYAKVKGKEYFINFYFMLRENTPWAKRGHVVASDQLRAGGEFVPEPYKGDAAAKVEVDEDEKTVTIKAGPTVAKFCRKSGTLCELTMHGKTVLKDIARGVPSGPQLTCSRAFTDNDRWIREGNNWGEDRRFSFYASGLTQLTYHAHPLKVEFANGGVRVLSKVDVFGAKSAGFKHISKWKFEKNGVVTVENDVKPFGKMPPALPRIGTSWKLDKRLEKMAYYGRGPRENYVDRKTGSFLGYWESTVTEQFEPYVRPQDNGYKCDVRSVCFTDNSGNGVEFTGSVPMFVQALHYGMEDMELARHRNGEKRFRSPLREREEVMLNLDIRQLGLGGASCGPRPMEKYMYRSQPENWTLTITPVKGKKFLGIL